MASTAELAYAEKSHTQSINQSLTHTAYFDASGTEAQPTISRQIINFHWYILL